MKVSIVTINRNNAEGLERTLNSVLTQTYGEFEYIIVDGASTDNSVDVIKEYVRKMESGEWIVKSVAWISEPDSGIYEAMNKGVRMAHGEYVLMLNSADCLANERVIEQIMQELDGTDIIQGNIIELQPSGKIRNRGYGRSKLDYADVFAGHILHQASFCKRDLFERYGYFDETYKLAGDTKFFMTCLGKYNASFKYVDIDITNYDCTGISSATSGPNYEKHVAEYRRLHQEMFSQRLSSYILDNKLKIRLYDRLHEHKWLWNLTMVLAHCYDLLYGKKDIEERVE